VCEAKAQGPSVHADRPPTHNPSQASAAPLLLLHASERRLPDAAPEVAGRLEAGGLSMAFLNNSSSRWESLMEPWRVTVALSDPINPIFKSARTTYLQVESLEPVKVNFHPSCLLTIGDCLAFSRELSAAQAWDGNADGEAAAGAAAPSGASTTGRALPRVPSAARLTPPPGDAAAVLGQGSAQLRVRAGSSFSGQALPLLPRSRSSGTLSFAPDGGRRGGFPGPGPALADAAAEDGSGPGPAGALGTLASVQQSIVLREAPPSMQEQMALGSCITSRVPQRCVAETCTHPLDPPGLVSHCLPVPLDASRTSHHSLPALGHPCTPPGT
jgi:hypothetical protein